MILFLIPARRGSKGVPDKNLIRLKEGGITLISRAVLFADDYCRKAGVTDYEIVVSTDYTPEECGVSETLISERPAELCTDDALMIDVVRYELTKWRDCKMVVLLQPTSPFRRSSDLQKAIDKIQQGDKVCVAIMEAKTHPARILPAVLSDYHFANRQDLPTFYERVGCFYVFDAEYIKQGGDMYSKNFGMVNVPSRYGVNIDTPEDVIFAKALAQEFDL